MHRPRNIFRFLVSTVLLVFLSPLAHADPAPVKSEYLHTFAGGFTYDRDIHGWTMFLYVQPVKKALGGGPLYLTATFQNPRTGGAVLVDKKSSLEAGKIGVELKTPVAGMRNRKAYLVTVQIYGDRARTQLLSTHTQKMLFHDVGDPEVALKNLEARHRQAHP